MVLNDVHRCAQHSPGARRIASLYAIPGLLAWGDAHDRIHCWYVPNRSSAACRELASPKVPVSSGMPMQEQGVDVPGCKVVHVDDLLISIAVPDPRSELARDIPHQLNLVALPVLIPRRLGEGWAHKQVMPMWTLGPIASRGDGHCDDGLTHRGRHNMFATLLTFARPLES